MHVKPHVQSWSYRELQQSTLTLPANRLKFTLIHQAILHCGQ